MRTVESLKELRAGEFALIRVDPFTGVPVDDAGEWVRGERVAFLCFASEREARDYAQQQLATNRLTEFSLFAPTGEQVAVLHDKPALEAHRAPRARGLWQRIRTKLRRARRF